MKKKVAVAMSGGVDSGTAAAILVKQGYKTVGFHMRLWHEEVKSSKLKVKNFENKCCSTESLEAARKTAHKLEIPFYVIDFKDIFKKKVVDYFLEEYAAGLTPNPCVMCNKFIKFGELLDYVRRLGYDFLATGHYARISPRRSHGFTGVQPATVRGVSSLHRLLQACDKAKDQTYFLYNLTQRQLAHILFPVGDFTKKQVVAMAKKWKLPVAERPESQEICFFPETDYRPFLRRQIPEKIVPGEVVDTKGRVIGRHLGLPLYTIGQRHGFEINATRPPAGRAGSTAHVTRGVIPPFYVIGKDIKKNQLIVGFGKETERKEFWVKEVNWVIKPVNELTSCELKCWVRIRHQGELLNCRVMKTPPRWPKGLLGGEGMKAILSEPERGIAPGQAAVFYGKTKDQRPKTNDQFEVLGGGIIAIDKK